jgi:outer membrane murein-binding lipoprotein Lpp
MMKQTLIAPAVVGLMTLLSGQTPSTQARPASIDDLVTEVRALRADVQQMADASIRAQLLVARLQVQEQRIAGIARQLTETEEQIRALDGVRNPFVTQMLKDFDKEPVEPGEVNLFAGMKAQLEKIENGDPVLKERQATLSHLLSDEQARWLTFNAQLEELEKLVTATKRR